MTLATTILSQKTHIIYGIIIVLIASVAYHFFKKDPEIITKTLTKVQTKIQTVTKVVTKDKIVYVDRTITTHKVNGDTIVEVDHEHSDTATKADIDTKTKTQTTVISKTTESFMKNYSIEAMFPIYNDSFSFNTNPLDTQISFGVRVFSLPVFAVVGTNFHFNQALVGLRMEF